ncbi:MAG: phage virion morphogenesis protein [Sphingomonadales bacterium]|jgi:phage virion morphogenesis protein
MSTEDLDALAGHFDDLAGNLAPAQRRRLAVQLARQLRASQADRIARQQDPDGEPFAPRARQPYRLRRRAGALRDKGPMFAKLRTTKHLKASATADEAAVGFTGRDAGIATTSQFGLREQIGRGIIARYPERRLLGLTDEERAGILDAVLASLTDTSDA